MKILRLIMGLLTLIACQENGLADTPFEGVRAGVQVGYGLIDSKVKITRADLLTGMDNSDVSGRGAIGGFTIDWMSLVGNSDIVMGAEASFNFITSKGKKSTQGTFLSALAGAELTTTVQLRRSYDVTAKVGYMFKGTAMAYVKAGPSMSHWKANSVSNAYPAKGASSANILGLIIGAGAEFPLTEERLTGGVEYNYRTYKDFTHTLNNNAGTPLRNLDVKPSSHAIMLRLNYKLSAVDFTTSAPVKERKRKRVKRPRNVN